MATGETHGTFSDFLALASPELRSICEALRNRIAALDADFVGVAWPRQKIASFGVGPRKMTEHYVYIGLQKSQVNLGFHRGASLHDPRGILEGTGKQLRHVRIRNVRACNNAHVIDLLRQAIADRRANVDA